MKKNSLPTKIFITDENRLKDPLPIVRLLPSGSAVIFRHYNDPDRIEIAKTLIKETRGRHIKILIAGDVRLALLVGAQGIHITETMAKSDKRVWQHWRKPYWLVTAAAHSPIALIRAKKLGANAALLSPVFPTISHPEISPIGVVRFSKWSRGSSLAIYALGGVTNNNVCRLKNSKIQGIAGISNFINKC